MPTADRPFRAHAGPSASAAERRVEQAFRWAIALIAAWLFACLVFVNIEFDDGYSTIGNSRYLLGLSEIYFWQRGPMLALLLMPAEALAHALGLPPMDVRFQHATMLAIHLVYLAGTWYLLVKHQGLRWSVLLAFLAAVPCVVFFSYAPFISHDLFPGLLALGMLWLGQRYAEKPGRRTWWALVFLGTLAVLVKQTYALVWLALVLATAMIDWRAATPRQHKRSVLLGLLLAVMLTGAITWSLYGAALAGSFPQTPWILRPWQQIQLIVGIYQREGPLRDIFYQWVYLRNMSAYGVLATALIIPGLYLSLRSRNALQSKIAVAWILLFAMMQLTAFKEVRYLGFLAPLSAFVIVPAIDQLMALRRAYGGLLLMLWLVDLSGIQAEARRIFNPYYKEQMSSFLAELPQSGHLAGNLVMTGQLNFISPEKYAFFGDRFHRITHLNLEQIGVLYGYPKQQLKYERNPKILDASQFKPADILVFVNDIAARVPPIRPDNKTSLQPYFVQLVATAELITLERHGDRYQMAQPSPQPIMLLRSPGVTAEPVTTYGNYAIADVERLTGTEDDAQKRQVLGFRVHALCNIAGCQQFVP